MLGNSWPRGSDQVGDVLVAEGHAQQRAARLLDSEVRAQFQQRSDYSFVQAKVKKTRTAQQEAVPVLQIVTVKLFEGGLGSIGSNTAKISPAHSSNAAIVVSLALKTGLTERQRREIGNRSGRQQRYRDTLVTRGAAGDPRDSCQQNMSPLSHRYVAQNQRVSFVIGKRERARQEFQLRRREPRQSLESAQSVEISFVRFSSHSKSHRARVGQYPLSAPKPISLNEEHLL